MIRLRTTLALAGLLFFQPVLAQPEVPERAYLFTYFVDNGQDGLRLAWSADGLEWHALNQARSYLQPLVGKARLMRDPCVAQGPDGTFHMVWTDSWDSRSIGYASTRDFLTWSPQRELAVMAHEPETRNCWAPEIVYDPGQKRFQIFWASTLPSKFTETWADGKDDNNHRTYAVTTRDFQTFSPTVVFFDPGFNSIDTTLHSRDGKHYLFFKDERKVPSPMKNLRLAVADRMQGPFRTQEEPVTPPGLWLEGPTTLRVGDFTYLYADAYIEGRFVALRSRDLKDWEDVSSELRVPQGMRHGTTFEVDGAVVRRLLEAAEPAALAWQNPIVPQRADPHVTLHSDGWYYLVATAPEYDRIELRKARTLGGLADAEVKTIWTKKESGPMSYHIWAPELHHIDGRWYLYFAASEAADIWKIRMYALENAADDPFADSWQEKGQIQTPWESFSLDATTFEHKGIRYYVWTQRGPDGGGTNLYLARMDSPTSITGEPVLLTRPDLPWEQRGHHVNEAPAVLIRNGKIFITYSASATDANYCLGLLVAEDSADLLDPRSWKKSLEPVFTSSHANGQYGPGHNGFTTCPEGKTDILVYHARSYERIQGEPLRNPDRATRAQVLLWKEDGMPDFGSPVPNGPYRADGK